MALPVLGAAYSLSPAQETLLVAFWTLDPILASWIWHFIISQQVILNDVNSAAPATSLFFLMTSLDDSLPLLITYDLKMTSFFHWWLRALHDLKWRRKGLIDCYRLISHFFCIVIIKFLKHICLKVLIIFYAFLIFICPVCNKQNFPCAYFHCSKLHY